MSSSSTSPGLVRLGRKPGVGEYLRALWVRREFALAIPTARLQAEHRNTVLGGMWHVLNPLLQVAVYFVVFGVILEVNRDVDNFIGFLTIGVFVFHFTSKSMTAGAKAITSNEGLIRAIMFPRAILPLAVVLSEFVAFGYALITMFAVILVTGEQVAWTWLLIVPILALQLLFNIGLSLFAARLSDHFRDIQQVLPFLTRLWLYLSGVLWPTQSFVDAYPRLEQLLYLNPAFVYIELVRAALLEAEVGSAQLWLSGALWAVVALVAGFAFFKARENEYGRG